MDRCAWDQLSVQEALRLTGYHRDALRSIRNTSYIHLGLTWGIYLACDNLLNTNVWQWPWGMGALFVMAATLYVHYPCSVGMDPTPHTFVDYAKRHNGVDLFVKSVTDVVEDRKPAYRLRLLSIKLSTWAIVSQVCGAILLERVQP